MYVLYEVIDSNGISRGRKGNTEEGRLVDKI